LVFGAIDDLWQNPRGEFMVVDYKATSKAEAINSLDKEWHEGYKRQMEIYQWLLRQKRPQGLRYRLFCLLQRHNRQGGF